MERPSGIRWNDWGTQYKVVSPENLVVLWNKWPIAHDKKQKVVVTDKKGKKSTVYKNVREIEYVVYSSYNDYLRTPEIVNKGRDYIKNVVETAADTLREKAVKSRAFPNALVADVKVLSPAFFEKIPILEQSDLGEFLLDSKGVSDRIKVLLAINGENAFGKTCNKVSACGWVQFTPATYSSIRKTYLSAGLIQDFETGAADHKNSMMAAMLLYDYNLANLMKNHGSTIAINPRLEEYLAAAYNGAPKWVDKSLRAFISRGLNWTGYLKTETKGFIAKLRLISQDGLM